MKYSIYTFFVLILFSCGTSKPIMNSSVAINSRTSDTISTKEIPLRKGTIYYIASTDYEYILPNGYDIFHHKHGGISAGGGREITSGFSSSSYQTDTLIQSQFLVDKALSTVIESSPPEVESMYNTERITDKEVITNVIQKYQPEYVISMDKLEFQIQGKLHDSAIGVNYYYSGEGINPYRDSQLMSSGNIQINYSAEWSIKDLNDNSDIKINQTGTMLIEQPRRYYIIEYLTKSANQAGKDFLSLLKLK